MAKLLTLYDMVALFQVVDFQELSSLDVLYVAVNSAYLAGT